MKTLRLTICMFTFVSLAGCYTELLIEEQADNEPVNQPETTYPDPWPTPPYDPCPIPVPPPVVIIVTGPTYPTQTPTVPLETLPHRDSGVQRTGSEVAQTTSQESTNRGGGAERTRR